SSSHEAPIATAAARADIRPTLPAKPDPPPSAQVPSPVQPPVQPPPVQAPAAQPPPVQVPSMDSRAKVTATEKRPAATPVPSARGARAPLAASTGTSTGSDFSPALKKRHLGHLTVHSSASYAKVFMMFNQLGRVEEK